MRQKRLSHSAPLLSRLYRVLAALVLVLGLSSTGACHLASDLVGYDIKVWPVTDKVDLLVVVDNSHGTIMADKVTLFNEAIKGLVEELAQRVDDMHVGVITTSLGSAGAPLCADDAGNDRGRLISRGIDGDTPIIVPTYQNKGVLVLSPNASEEAGVFNEVTPMVTALRQIIQGAGNDGCGYESTLEAWYRFLVEPEPYDQIELVEDNGTLVAEASGIDATVLLQRETFMRPDSLLIVVVLSDENDCSLRAGGSFYLAAQVQDPNAPQTPFHLPRPRYICKDDPHDVCCTSCGVPPPEGCDTSLDDCGAPLSETEDPFELRCFDQKRRFGVDFLYPIDRYVAGLADRQVADSDGNVFDNPIFAQGRDPRLVLYASIIGVPWQDIARRTNGKPDINEGLDANGLPAGGFQTAAEMAANNTWDLILGDPQHYYDAFSPQRPTDPLMHESRLPREGMHPLLPEDGSPKAPDNKPDANVINGHEHEVDNDIQYACIFKLQDALPCGSNIDCGNDCSGEAPVKNPLCQHPEEPLDDSYGKGQHYVQAYPGIRHLELMKRLGPHAVIGSICPVQGVVTGNLTAYIPSADALIEAAQCMLPGSEPAACTTPP